MINIFDSNFPGLYFFAKNMKLQFTFCTNNMAESAGLESPKKIIGKTDYDLCWKNYAPFYTLTDQKILTESLFYFNQIEKQQTKKGIVEVLISKYPLFNEKNNLIGIGGYYIDISQYYLMKKNGYYDSLTKRFYYTKDEINFYLTIREIEVLRLLMIGYQPKKIALLLKISRRTVEIYVENLKEKLHCSSKAEVINSAFFLGLNYLTLTNNFAEVFN